MPVSAGNSLLVALDQIPERKCIGVILYNDQANPYVMWQIEGNTLAQVALPPGQFYVPAVSVGSAASPNDNNAYLNFGQHPLDYTTFALDL